MRDRERENKMEQNIEKFSEILKLIGYTSTLNFYSLKSAFESPELKNFFEWFITSVNVNWHIKPEKLEMFRLKQAKGHVIWDLNKLIEMNKLYESSLSELNSENNMSETDLEDENEQMEKEIRFLSEQLGRQKSYKKALDKKLDHLKLEQAHTDLVLDKLDKQLLKEEETLKEVCHSVDSSFASFQENLGNEEQFQCKFTEKIASLDANFINYIAKEKELLTSLKEKIALKYEYDYIEHEFKLAEDVHLKKELLNEYKQYEFLFTNEPKSSCNQSTRNEFNKLESYLKLINKHYLSIINDWFTAKLTYEIERANLDEMKRMYDERDKFLEYSQSELGTDPLKLKSLEIKINALKEKQIECIRQIEQLNPKIVAKLEMFTKLKIQQIIENDMKKKQIELNLYLNKQEKILTCLNNQSKRIKSINHLHKEKLDEIDLLRGYFSDLNKFAKTNSTTNSNHSVLLQPNVSFSVSMANLLSSTSIPLSPGRFKQNQNSTMIAKKINHSLSYNGNLSAIGSEIRESPFMHLINQLLITMLTSLKSDKYCQKYIKLTKPISVNFDDNLENFIHVYDSLENSFSRTSNSNRKHLFKLIKLVENAMELMYSKQNGELNLSQIKIRTTRHLDDEYDQFERRFKLNESRFAAEILSKIKKHNEILKSNELEKLKRNFFVIFYTQPHMVQNLIEQINAFE